jgi:glutamate synthase (NADPH/NADH) small chain
MTVGEVAWLEEEESLGTRPSILVNTERCAGCQECVVRCPEGALSLNPEEWVVVGDRELCVGCRQCERTCPYGAIHIEGPVLVPARTLPRGQHRPGASLGLEETRRGFASWEEAAREAERCLACPDPTCVLGCPTHNDIPGFIAALRAGRFEEARDILAETTVFPDICSRVCDQATQCEGACSLTLAGAEPVAIGLLERFVSDRAGVPPLVRKGELPLKVAVVGSGPAGMAAAWDLIAAGAEVTMFEKRDEGLGVLGWGIPSFTLPEAVAERPLKALKEAGLDLRTGVTVGRDVSVAALLAGYDAVVMAHGASVPLSLKVPGADLPGIEDATSFLVRAKAALRAHQGLPDLPRGTRLLVVGAGNTAMDVARSARRLGASVVAVDILDRRFARVRPDELAEAESEGVEVRFGRQVDHFEGGAEGVEAAYLARTRQTRADERPRRMDFPLERLAVDHVVVAMGYRVDPEPVAQTGLKLPLPRPDLRHRVPPRRWLASGILAEVGRGIGLLAREREEMRQKAARPLRDRLFVVGDALTGPATVVAAMAQGRAAARAILAGAVAPEEGRAEEGEGRLPLRPVGALLLFTLGMVLLLAGAAATYSVLAIACGALLVGLDALSGWIHTWVDEQTRRLGT